MSRAFFLKACAFIKRDFLIESSYKTGMAIEILKSVIPTISFYFIGKVVGDGKYFTFAIVGVAFSQYMMHSLSAFSDTIRRQQMAGCLEAILSTRTGSATVILLSPVYSLIAKSLHVFLVFAVGGIFLGVDFSRANPAAVIATLLLSSIALSSIGIFSATVILMWKKGDPVTMLVGSLGTLLGGAFFPREVLPGWTQTASLFNPIAHAIDAMRLALFGGAWTKAFGLPIAVLGISGCFLLPASVWCFAKAVDIGRRDGSLLKH